MYISFNNSLPTALSNIGTWTSISGGYVLKTITSGTGGTTSSAGNTGSTTLSINQIPSHTHSFTAGAIKSENAMQHQAAGSNWYKVGTTSVDATAAAGGGQGHTHTAGMPANISVYMWKRTA